eukprot:1185265-Prorocentrum_minimum.AAC.2
MAVGDAGHPPLASFPARIPRPVRPHGRPVCQVELTSRRKMSLRKGVVLMSTPNRSGHTDDPSARWNSRIEAFRSHLARHPRQAIYIKNKNIC